MATGPRSTPAFLVRSSTRPARSCERGPAAHAANPGSGLGEYGLSLDLDFHLRVDECFHFHEARGGPNVSEELSVGLAYKFPVADRGDVHTSAYNVLET